MVLFCFFFCQAYFLYQSEDIPFYSCFVEHFILEACCVSSNAFPVSIEMPFPSFHPINTVCHMAFSCQTRHLFLKQFSYLWYTIFTFLYVMEFYVSTPKNQSSFIEMNVVLVMDHLEWIGKCSFQ